MSRPEPSAVLIEWATRTIVARFAAGNPALGDRVIEVVPGSVSVETVVDPGGDSYCDDDCCGPEPGKAFIRIKATATTGRPVWTEVDLDGFDLIVFVAELRAAEHPPTTALAPANTTEETR